MEKRDWKSLASMLFCIAFFGILVFLFFKYVFVVLVPFFIAWGIALPIYPIACKFSKRTGISRKICSFILMLIFLSLVILLLFWLGNRILFELQRFGEWLVANSDMLVSYFEDLFASIDSIGKKIPILNKFQDIGFVDKIIENIDAVLTKIWDGFIDSLSRAVPDIAGTLVRSLPSALLVTVVTVVSCFYFSMDIELVHKTVKSLVPESISKYFPFLKERVFYAVKKYFKAYFLLFLITFGELFVGFLVLGIDYSLVLALLIAVVDFLPVLGTGTVLVPWAIVMLFVKNYYLGFGILILYAITCVVRQVIEPKILGKSLGIHPILTLVGIYIGYRLFGFLGMILTPMIILILFSIFRSKEKTE